jgi:hypothetical protein
LRKPNLVKIGIEPDSCRVAGGGAEEESSALIGEDILSNEELARHKLLP